jgi:hypothetical protein
MRRRRLTTAILHDALCDFSERGRERCRAWRQRVVHDPRLLHPVASMLTGPESAPAELMTTDAVRLVRELGG